MRLNLVFWKMKKRLSSRLTSVYKTFGVIWCLLILVLTIIILATAQNPLGLFALVMILPSIPFLKLNKITFDENFIYITKWWKEQKYELGNIKSINEGDITSMDPFFEIEIYSLSGTIKFEFMPKFIENLTFFFKKKYIGSLLELRLKYRV
jgi:hypothetical protein